MLTITDLPTDIHDTIAAFLPDKDLIDFVCASRQIVVSPYLLRQRQRAYWKKHTAIYLTIKGDLAGLQYLHGCGGLKMDLAIMNVASCNGHLAVVQFLHGIGATCTAETMDFAAYKGHMAVVQFLHSTGVTCTTQAMDWASSNGHLAVVQFLHSIGASFTDYAMNHAANEGHLAVVEFLHSIGAPLFDWWRKS